MDAARRAARRTRLRAGWRAPGPPASGDWARADLRPGAGETLDALVGDWCILQLDCGHRHSTDDLLVAWYAAAMARRRGLEPRALLDLGCGVGSVGLMMAWQFPQARLLGIEAQAQSVALARRSAAWNGVSDRVEMRAGDLRDPQSLPEGAAFDLITGSPPYFDPAAGRLSDRPQRAPCRFELRGGVEAYCEAASRALRPGGLFTLVAPASSGDRIAGAAQPLHIIASREVVFKAGRPPALVLMALAGDRGHSPLPRSAAVDEAPLLLREADGRRTEAFRALRLQMGFPPRAA